MRITGGKAARRILKVPKGLAVRPTPDLVKQAVFNSLGGRVVGARVLELFAGTGALSLECLSRGATSAVCVEKSSRHAETLRQNFQLAGFPPETLQVRVQDVFAALAQLETAGQLFDLILADPPYEPGAAKIIQNLLKQYPILKPGGFLAIEHGEKDPDLEPEFTMELVRQRKYGETLLTLFKAP